MTREVFTEIVLDVLARHGGSVTSWFRSAAHNARVGGVRGSLHLEGLAVDCVFDLPVQKDRATAAFNAIGFGVLDEGDHIHVQARPLKGAK
jgi:uncharacterized protein YcbK (DUF882 family)